MRWKSREVTMPRMWFVTWFYSGWRWDV